MLYRVAFCYGLTNRNQQNPALCWVKINKTLHNLAFSSKIKDARLSDVITGIWD